MVIPEKRKSEIILFLLLSSFSLFLFAQGETEDTDPLLKNITWIGQACVKIDGTQKVYFDPYEIKNKDQADIILITHDHEDHFSPQDIDMINGENTHFVAPSCVTRKLGAGDRIKTVKPGDVLHIEDVKIEVIPSYNLDVPYHAKSKGYVGFIVTMDNVIYFHPGDSDFIPEMRKVKADVVFLPVTPPYTMSPEKAAEAANVIKPKVAVPFHWGGSIGTRENAEAFVALCECKTVIIDPNNKIPGTDFP